jgi:hypothetical protein
MPHNSDTLRQAFQQLPPIDGDSFWDKKRGELREMVRTADPAYFLRWPTVVSTMFVGNAPWTGAELAALPRHYVEAIRETGLGSPELYDGYTSGNLIHQAYHLSLWETMIGRTVRNMRRIVEFGGGYGTMALIVHRLGFRGDYQIIDLPEFSLLQQWYLSNTLPDANRITWTDEPAACDLLIASHSLSESPLPLRDKILSDMVSDSYLFVYHAEHEGMDNLDYFAEFTESKPDYSWWRWATMHLPNQWYMMGAKL